MNRKTPDHLMDTETSASPQPTSVSDKPGANEYRAYKDGYYRGRSKATNEENTTRGFLIGAVLVLLFGLGGLIAYLMLQERPINVVPPTPVLEEGAEEGEAQDSNGSEAPQPNININITEPPATETPTNDVQTESTPPGSSTSESPADTTVNVEAPPAAPTEPESTTTESGQNSVPEANSPSSTEASSSEPVGSPQPTGQPLN